MKPKIPAVISSSNKIAKKIAYCKKEKHILLKLNLISGIS